MAQENIGDEGLKVPLNKLQEAVRQCCQDSELRDYYEKAPAGARQFVALRFYGSLFGEDLSDDEYGKLLEATESKLSLDDLVYLGNHDPDTETKAHLRQLLDLRMAERRRGLGSSAAATSSVAQRKTAQEKGLKRVADIKREEAARHAEAPVSSRFQKLEEEVRMEKRAARIAYLTKSLTNITLAAILGGVGFVAWNFWQKHNAEQDAPLSDEVSAPSKKESREQAHKQAERNAKAESAQSTAAKSAETIADTNKISEAERTAKENSAYFEAVLAPFKKAKVDYWKNAPKEDRPEKATSDKHYVALVPAEEGFILLNMDKKPGATMSFREVSRDGGAGNEISPAEFKELTAATPFFVLCGKRVYFCSAKKKGQTYAVPKKGDQFDPGREEFGGLADLTKDHGMDVVNMKYRVGFTPNEEFARPIPIAEVKFGESLSREDFFEKVKAKMVKTAERRAANNESSRKNAAKKKVYKRTVVWGTGPRIKKRLDGVTEVPRTCPVDYWHHRSPDLGRTIYRSNRWRKMDNRYDEWRALCDEAARQEQEAAAFTARVETEAHTPVARKEITDTDVNDALDAGEVTFEPAK